MTCVKKKFGRIRALMVVANAQKPTQKSIKRKEVRVYFCKECKAFHTTSKK